MGNLPSTLGVGQCTCFARDPEDPFAYHGPMEPETTADNFVRRKAKARVESRLQLTEAGTQATRFYDKQGVLLATGYQRVLYGDHGAYVEMAAEQIRWDAFVPGPQGEYYNVWKSTGSKAQLYFQLKSVEDKPSAPKAKGRELHSFERSEGYADYRPGLCYVSVKAVCVEQPGATGRRTWEPPVRVPHKTGLKEALKQIQGVQIREFAPKVRKAESERRRYAWWSEADLAGKLGVVDATLVRSTLWLVDEVPAAIVLTPLGLRTSEKLLGEVLKNRGCGVADGPMTLRMATPSVCEKVLGVKRHSLMPPLSPVCDERVGLPVILDSTLTARPVLVLEAACGIAAIVHPDLLTSLFKPAIHQLVEPGDAADAETAEGETIYSETVEAEAGADDASAGEEQAAPAAPAPAGAASGGESPLRRAQRLLNPGNFDSAEKRAPLLMGV